MKRAAIITMGAFLAASAAASPVRLEQAVEGLWGLDREASMNVRSLADCETAPTRFDVNSDQDRAASISMSSPAAPITNDIEIDSLILLADGGIAMEVRMPVKAFMTIYPADRMVFELRDAAGEKVPGHTIVLKRCPKTAFF